jgi:hypothetical protein
MTQDDVLKLFRESGALLEGHFKLSSGLHSGGYLQCALVLQHPPHAEALGRALAGSSRRIGRRLSSRQPWGASSSDTKSPAVSASARSSPSGRRRC